MRNLIAILLFCLSFSAHATESHYAIIVDAGSSGSRLHIFQYDDSKPLPIIKDIYAENISPALSSFANQPEAAGGSLKKLFDNAAEKLKALHVDQATVTVDVLATAGMRLLTPEAQQAIYSSVRDFLNNHYTLHPQRIETIEGKMEGIYGWLDVNYLANRFNSDADTTFGIIDMGGASSEIAFSTTDRTKSNDESTLTIAGKSYTVYSKSILGAGQDKAREAMNRNIDAASCYPAGYAYAPNTLGHFNYRNCFLNYTSVITQFSDRNDMPTLADHEFVAYSGIYYAFHFFDVDKTPTKEKVIASIEATCTKDWEKLKQAYPSVAEKYLASYCANGVYQTSLLFDSYRVSNQQLHVQDSINQNNIDWTLGALLSSLL